jgi:signal transduction histidine kinase
MEMVGARFNGRNGGPVEVSGSGAGSIPARKAQLCLLVLRNLVDNALEATPDGRPVRIRSRMNEQLLVVDVEDNGPGVPDRIRQHLFEPVTSAKANGTGIGLAISSVIARHIPARLELTRTGPEGTVFTLEIPT